MAILKVHGQDFLEAESEYNAGFFKLKTKERKFYGETISVKKVESVEIVNKENLEQIKKKMGWATAGAVFLGPIGLAAGLLFSGRTQEKVTFIAKFKDGRVLCSTTDSDTYEDIKKSVYWNLDNV